MPAAGGARGSTSDLSCMHMQLRNHCSLRALLADCSAQNDKAVAGFIRQFYPACRLTARLLDNRSPVSRTWLGREDNKDASTTGTCDVDSRRVIPHLRDK